MVQCSNCNRSRFLVQRTNPKCSFLGLGQLSHSTVTKTVEFCGHRIWPLHLAVIQDPTLPPSLPRPPHTPYFPISPQSTSNLINAKPQALPYSSPQTPQDDTTAPNSPSPETKHTFHSPRQPGETIIRCVSTGRDAENVI
jgi:hypothetical protein